ncbi:hypothetical protein BT67DRAFT_257863 [Trichocladium antarcticum]|uniref:Uncharacterized protein n=1 Tax=Trichocladium antarcticum TaxID=1450529 RepID=A0AAN6UMY7_9PEZI|nr:hypothetical protein BT67DRAFT_257863 [Trichocladium antarcticum]
MDDEQALRRPDGDRVHAVQPPAAQVEHQASSPRGEPDSADTVLVPSGSRSPPTLGERVRHHTGVRNTAHAASGLCGAHFTSLRHKSSTYLTSPMHSLMYMPQLTREPTTVRAASAREIPLNKFPHSLISHGQRFLAGCKDPAEGRGNGWKLP